MADLQELRLNYEQIERRIRFLEERAHTHIEKQHEGRTPADRQACVGTLLRDAGSLALLLEDYGRAATLLRQAGEAWASIGLFAGFLLLRLSGEIDWPEKYEKHLGQISRILEPPELMSNQSALDAATHEDPAYLRASASSTRQLLDLYQALPDRSNDTSNHVAGMIKQRLSEVPGRSIDGIRVSSYIAAFDAVSEGYLERDQADTVFAMTLNRAEQLAIAQANIHQWQMGLNPAAIIGFDLLALCTRAVNSNSAKVLDEVMWNRSSLVTLPWTLAQRLRPEPDPSPRHDFV
jgi:hypothetical protein